MSNLRCEIDEIELTNKEDHQVEIPNQDLVKNVVLVQSFMNKYDLNIKFMIAGGSVFSSLNGTDYDDIDVFFQSTADITKVVKAVGDDYVVKTKNAISLYINNRKVQFILCKYGEPMEVLESFDVSCSKIGITSDFKMLRAETYSDEVHVDVNNIGGDTLSRVIKYSEKKGAKISPNLIRQITKILLDGFYDTFLENYNSEPIEGRHLISQAIPLFRKRRIPKYAQLVHDMMKNTFKNSYDLMRAYSEVRNLAFYLPPKQCDEFICTVILRDKGQEVKYASDRILQVKVKFPELFI